MSLQRFWLKLVWGHWWKTAYYWGYIKVDEKDPASDSPLPKSGHHRQDPRFMDHMGWHGTKRRKSSISKQFQGSPIPNLPNISKSLNDQYIPTKSTVNLGKFNKSPVALLGLVQQDADFATNSQVLHGTGQFDLQTRWSLPSARWPFRHRGKPRGLRGSHGSDSIQQAC